MEFIRGASSIRARHYGCVASVGNYDGVHLGHQQVIRSLAKMGESLRLPTAVITFEPHPMEFFVPDRAPPRLMTVREKIEAMSSLGVDVLCCLRFNHDLANTEPEDFIKDLLVDKLGVEYFVVGDDFRFGRNRRGDFEMLRSLGETLGMQVARTESFTMDGNRVSSTRIRECLKSGDLTGAAKMLGREYSMSGKVVRGDGNGRRWGFATANVKPDFHNLPLSGIFIAEVTGIAGHDFYPAAASLGVRPTVDGDRKLLEVHVLDFDQDIYGRQIHVRFLKKLRDEIKFDSIDAMKGQIFKDIARTREFFDVARSRAVS